MQLFDAETAIFKQNPIDDVDTVVVIWSRPLGSEQRYSELYVKWLKGETKDNKNTWELICSNLDDSDTEQAMFEAAIDAEVWAKSQAAN